MAAVSPANRPGPAQDPSAPRSRPNLSLARVLVGHVPPGLAVIPFLGLRVLLLLGLCVFFLPTYFFDLPGFGAEASWKLTLSRAIYKGWGFGDQVIWTYGPLGFLEWRYPFGIHPGCYLAFDLLLLGLFLRFAIDVGKSNCDTVLAWACLASLFTVKRLIHDQPPVAVFCVLLYLVLRNLARPSLMDGAALVLVSVIALLFKMNLGLMGFFFCAVILLFKAKARQKSAFNWVVLLVLQAGVAWLVALQLHTHLFAYLKSGLTIVAQYNNMAWGPGLGGVAHWIVFGFFWLYVALAAAYLRKNGFATPATLYLVLGGAAGFVLYKTALIRSDYNHNKCFLLGFPILCLAFLIHGPEKLRRLWRLLFVGSTAYASLLMVAEFGNALIYMRRDYLQVFFPINYVQGIKDYRPLRDWNAYALTTLADHLDRTVPQGVRELIGTNSVDVFPFESTLALGSGLNYKPRPIPLTYGVMGKTLESRNLAFLESAGAPRFILYVLGEAAHSIDGRYHLWEEPAVKRLLARQYSPQLIFTNLQGASPETDPKPSPVLLLRRGPIKTPPGLSAASTTRERTGVEFVLPEHTEELYANIRLKQSWLGRVVSFLYRGSEVTARFSLDDGSVRELRVLPANLEAGVLVNYFADSSNPAHLLNYLTRQSRGNPKCLKLEIHPQRPWAYRREFEVSYLKAPSHQR
jgi:hypothetical protein